MNPQEKAKELFDICYQLAESIEWTNKETMQKAELLNDELGDDVLFYWHELAKQSAFIVVEQMMLTLPFSDNRSLNNYAIWMQKYLEQVKHEIQQL